MICDKYRGKNTGPQCVKRSGSGMRSSGNVQSNLTKTPNQGGRALQSAFEVRYKFKQFFFNSSSGFENGGVQCQVGT
jgi:hypothetical protein